MSNTHGSILSVIILCVNMLSVIMVSVVAAKLYNLTKKPDKTWPQVGTQLMQFSLTSLAFDWPKFCFNIQSSLGTALLDGLLGAHIYWQSFFWKLPATAILALLVFVTLSSMTHKE